MEYQTFHVLVDSPNAITCSSERSENIHIDKDDGLHSALGRSPPVHVTSGKTVALGNFRLARLI